MKNYNTRTNCAICNNENLLTVMNYGELPLAGDFPLDKNNFEKIGLQIKFCPGCFLMQTDSIIDPDRLFKNYRYMSSVRLTKHFTEVAIHLKNYFDLNKTSKILEIGSNDGVLLKPLQELGLNPIGVEPAINIAEIAIKDGCNTINDYFSAELVDKYHWEGIFDLIVSNNCFAHIDGINSITSGIHKALKSDGILVIEVHYIKPLIESLQYDNIYHEHMYYYSLHSLNNLFSLHGMTIIDFEEIPVHAGSIRVYIKNSEEKLNKKIINKLHEESELGLTNFEWYKTFSKKALNHIKQTSDCVRELTKKGFKVAGYGASGRANMLCNLCKFDSSIVSYIVDESPERIGRYIAATDIKIVDKRYMFDDKPDYVLIFAWNFAKMIIDKLEGSDCVFLVPFPEMQVVNHSSELKNFIGL